MSSPSYSWLLDDLDYLGSSVSSCTLREITCDRFFDPEALVPPQLEIKINFHREYYGITMIQDDTSSYKLSLRQFISSSERSRFVIVRQLLYDGPLEHEDWLRNVDAVQFYRMVSALAWEISSYAYESAREEEGQLGDLVVITAEIDLQLPNPPPQLQQQQQQQQRILSLIGERKWRTDSSGSGGGGSSSSVCTVCLDDFVSGERVATLHCFHHFYTDCILKWLLLQTSRMSCPICRTCMSVN